MESIDQAIKDSSAESSSETPKPSNPTKPAEPLAIETSSLS